MASNINIYQSITGIVTPEGHYSSWQVSKYLSDLFPLGDTFASVLVCGKVFAETNELLYHDKFLSGREECPR